MNNFKKITNRELRSFALLLGSILIILFGLILPLLRNHEKPLWPWIIAFTVWTLGIFAPANLNLVYRLWIKIGALIGWIETRVVLAIVFYLIVVPTGVTLRFFKKKSSIKNLNLNSVSYRISSKNRNIKSMEKPF